MHAYIVNLNSILILLSCQVCLPQLSCHMNCIHVWPIRQKFPISLFLAHQKRFSSSDFTQPVSLFESVKESQSRRPNQAVAKIYHQHCSCVQKQRKHDEGYRTDTLQIRAVKRRIYSCRRYPGTLRKNFRNYNLPAGSTNIFEDAVRQTSPLESKFAEVIAMHNRLAEMEEQIHKGLGMT